MILCIVYLPCIYLNNDNNPFIKSKMKTYKTTYLSKKADEITGRAIALDHTLARALKFASMVDIKVSAQTIKELQSGNYNTIKEAIQAQYEKLENDLIMVRLKNGNEKTLAAKDEILVNLKREVLYLKEKALPDYLWSGSKISDHELKKYIQRECTVDLSEQQLSDLHLIEAVGKVLPRFNPIDFVDGQKVNAEAYLEYTNLINN